MRYLVKILIFILFVTSNQVISQSKYVADKYFSEFAYKNAAEAYESIYNKGDKSYEIVSRIADSYYFNTNFEKSVKWYQKLYEKHGDRVLNIEHLFRYAQSLKGVLQYDKADEIMALVSRVDEFDSRAFKTTVHPDYVKEFSSAKIDVLSINNLSINTKYSDFGGFIHRGKLIFASANPTKTNKSLYKWNKQPFLDLYEGFLAMSTEDKIEVKKSIKLPFATKFHEASAVITKDGNTMYFTRDNYIDGVAGMSKENSMLLKIYRASLKDGKWVDITELPFNSDQYSVGHPALSPDEKTLYFVSNMPGGLGLTDVYKVEVLPDFKYGVVENLGAEINTEGREMFPFVSDDNVLYFSSDGHVGLGGLDIFESPIVSGVNGKARNLEVPFNSELDDFSFYINKSNTKGVFSSNRKGGKGDDDIYGFVLKKPKTSKFLKSLPNNINGSLEVEDQCEQSLSGIATNPDLGTELADVTVRLIDYEGKIIDQTQTDEFGMYQFKVNCDRSYKVLFVKKNYRRYFNSLSTNLKNKQANILNVELRSLIKDNKIAIKPIYFDFDKWNIRADSRYELENVVNVMRDNPSMRIKIESHTDGRGDNGYNKNLSQNRAKSTKDYIVSRGISPSRIISAIGYGEERLLNDCQEGSGCSEAQHQLNRRSYFIIVSDK